jgi:hypothetical protein
MDLWTIFKIAKINPIILSKKPVLIFFSMRITQFNGIVGMRRP